MALFACLYEIEVLPVLFYVHFTSYTTGVVLNVKLTFKCAILGSGDAFSSIQMCIKFTSKWPL